MQIVPARGRLVCTKLAICCEPITTGMNGAFIYYVQPGHTMCLGDNSAQSSDSRTWGTVPDRLMLGKAVFVFWPFYASQTKNRAVTR